MKSETVSPVGRSRLERLRDAESRLVAVLQRGAGAGETECRKALTRVRSTILPLDPEALAKAWAELAPDEQTILLIKCARQAPIAFGRR
jgi:hypothetical protein